MSTETRMGPPASDELDLIVDEARRQLEGQVAASDAWRRAANLRLAVAGLLAATAVAVAATGVGGPAAEWAVAGASVAWAAYAWFRPVRR